MKSRFHWHRAWRIALGTSGHRSRPAARYALALLCGAAIALASCASKKDKEPEHTWQMFVPPITGGSFRTVDTSVPITKWQAGTETLYSLGETCQKARADMIATWRAQARQYKSGENQQVLDEVARYDAGQCIRDDDPRMTY